MGRINVLDTQTANAIKAGEVIERPVSVVKELIDNSIDAGATSIRVEFENGGISLIRVSDNGIGMEEDDALKCFLIHATSKISCIEDIYRLSTMGFRGEALASIAACSEVTLITKMADKKVATLVKYEDGVLVENSECAADTGTSVTVKSLFANIPARYKFLKKDSTEGMYICSLVEKMAIINPEISFKLVKDGKVVLQTPGSGDMKDAIYSIYGKTIAEGLIPVTYEYENMKLSGYTGKTTNVRGNRALQYVYVNERCIKNASATAAIDEAYRNSVMKNKFPICFLSIHVPSDAVDVNVHPQKIEVKFTNESDVFRLIFHGIKQALSENTSAVDVFAGQKDTADLVTESKSKSDYTSSRQMSFAVTASPSNKAPSEASFEKNPSKEESNAAANLLKILSEFKPDIDGIKNGTTEEPSKSEENRESPIEGIELLPLDVPFENSSAPAMPAKEIEVFDEDKSDDIYELVHSKFVGFLFATYIIMQSEENVFFVDQHAAHERVMYEKFLAKRSETVVRDVQTLLVPQIVELTTGDYSFVSDNLEAFGNNGFDIELLGDRTIALRSVPVADSSESRLKSMSKPSVMFQMILEDIKKETPEKGSIWYSLIQTTACKAAIKAHDVITEEEALELLRQLSSLNDPYHCAHGRPTFIKMSQTDFEKNFKRIV